MPFRSSSTFAFALALILLGVVAPTAAAGPPIQSQPYTGAPVGGGCGEVAGQACPELPNSIVQFGPFAESPRAIDLRVDDALGARIGATFTMYDADGAPLKSGALCGALSKIRAPAGTTFVVVTLDSPANLGHHCGAPRYPTAGNVLLRLR